MCIRDSRIAGAQFELNKMAYTLADNDNGNNLHSGTDFYNTRIWETEEYTDSYVRFKPVSYTHLDVYKRQVRDKTCSICNI